jgi:hypothetical protein
VKDCQRIRGTYCSRMVAASVESSLSEGQRRGRRKREKTNGCAGAKEWDLSADGRQATDEEKLNTWRTGVSNFVPPRHSVAVRVSLLRLW